MPTCTSRRRGAGSAARPTRLLRTSRRPGGGTTRSAGCSARSRACRRNARHSSSMRARKYGSQPMPDSASTSFSPRVPFERAAEHHGGQRLVELQREQRRERGRLPLADPVAELRRRAALDVEADREPGLLRGGPQAIPGRVADVDVEDADDRTAVTDAPRCVRARPRRPRGSGRAGTRARTADRGRPR